jgi:G3E family GTPase
MVDAPAAHVPVTILTGFLGSGKTTWLNRWLRHPAMRDALVLVNEIGDVAVDHHLVQERGEDLVVLPSGCVCCALRGDLIEMLSDPARTRGRGRVVVETTGLADPTPLVATLVTHPELRDRFYLDAVVATLDAELGPATLTRHQEAVKQVALADLVVVTKRDRVGGARVEEVVSLARSLAPEARILDRPVGDADSGRGAAHSRHQDRGATSPRHAHGHDHLHGVRTFTLEAQRRVRYRDLAIWIAMTSQLNGDSLLRFKGLLRVTDHDDPIVVQAAQHVVHPPARLPGWPEGEPRTRLVGITRGMSEPLFDATVESLRSLLEPGAPSAPQGSSSGGDVRSR